MDTILVVKTRRQASSPLVDISVALLADYKSVAETGSEVKSSW
jgi:hypothetical protein